MKLRLREKSIRLRLLQSEIGQLREAGSVSETIVFGSSSDAQLIYSLNISPAATEISAQISNNSIEIFLPIALAENWIDTEIVGLYGTQTITDEKNLKIVVEKDFVCVDRPADADNKDAFSHPKPDC